MSNPPTQLVPDVYRVGWVCALPSEYAAAKAMLDERHSMISGQDNTDSNSYTLGRIHTHNVVLACLPDGVYGTNSAAVVAMNLVRTFRWIRFCLLVGIGGGIPSMQKGIDIRLGDIAVSRPSDASNGVVQWDKGKSLVDNQFTRQGQLNKPPTVLLTALASLRSEHELDESRVPQFLEEMLRKYPKMRNSSYSFPIQETDILQCTNHSQANTSCEGCDNGKILREPRDTLDPVIHYGVIASGNQVIKNAVHRDQIRDTCDGAICVEMEAAGLVDTFPCLVVRGICDYADSSKNDRWHKYAAATAAAFAKELLLYVSAEQASHEQPIKDILGQINSTVKENVQVAREILEENRTQSSNIQTEKQRNQERACLQTFKLGDYQRDKDINPDRAAGTCGWVLDHPHFQRWYNSSHNDLLWISADPGCGKSVLARSLVQHELANLQQTTTCYYFFKDNERQDRLAPALCAVLHQLFSDQPNLLRNAIPLWEKIGQKIQDEVGTLWQVLLRALSDREARAIVCVFDALDECRDDDRRELITWLCSFYERSLKDGENPATKFLVTSRSYDSVERWFQQLLSRLPHIQLRGEAENDRIHDEINLVIDQRLKGLAVEFSLSTRHQNELRQRLHKMAHRTYLWLYLAMEDIRNRYRDSPDPEEESINELPESVENAYEKILQRITVRQRPHARKILLIIVGSRRPLTISEVGLALNADTAYERDEAAMKEPNVLQLERYIREWCGLFVFINHSQLFLIHQTAKEFLTTLTNEKLPVNLWRGSLSSRYVEQVMAIICTTYLCLAMKTRQRPSYRSLNTRDDVDSSFFRYCAEHWTRHLSEYDTLEHRKLLENVLKLCSTTRAGFDSWFPFYWWVSGSKESDVPHVSDQHVIAMTGYAAALKERYERERFDPNQLDDQHMSALAWASQRGHQEVVQVLLDIGADIHGQGELNGLALRLASRNGHGKIVQILLDRGADIDAQGLYSSALQEASAHGYEEIVKALLDRGANVNQNGRNGSALQFASWYGRNEIVRTLLKNGTDVNQVGVFGSALQLASKYRGNEDIRQILVDNGARVDEEITRTSALQIASEQGDERMVQTLLDNGVDIDQEGPDGSALQVALVCGHEKIVQILLDRDAAVDQEGPNGSALQIASEQGDERMVQMLLDNGADINHEGIYGSALQIASRNGHEKLVQVIIDNGANINHEGPYGSPLRLAIDYSREKVVQILLNNGADPNQEGLWGSALELASTRAEKEIVQMLLDKGANINTQTFNQSALLQASVSGREIVVQKLLDKLDDVEVSAQELREAFCDALEVASDIGHEKIVQMLLNKGADVHPHLPYGSALEGASRHGHEKILQILLDGGVDVNAREGAEGSALLAALVHGREKIAFTLLDNGADVNCQGEDGGSALQMASQLGYKEAVQMILDKGADVKDWNSSYRSALRAAVQGGPARREIFKMLLDKGVSVNGHGWYSSALQAASQNGHARIAKMLLDDGVDVSQENLYGSAIQGASARGYNETVQMLLDKDAGTRLRRPRSASGWHQIPSAPPDHDQFNPLEVATEPGQQFSIAELLSEVRITAVQHR